VGVILHSRHSRTFSERVVERYEKFQRLIKEKEGKVNGSGAILQEKSISSGELEVANFSSGEISIQLKSCVRRHNVHLFSQFRQGSRGNNDNQYINIHEDIAELGLLLDTLKRSRVDSVSLYMPFMPYLRQDKKAGDREPISAKNLFSRLEVSGGRVLKGFATSDMHNNACEGFTDLPVDKIAAFPLFVLYYKVKLEEELKEKKVVVVSPDAGGTTRAEKLANCLGADVAVIYKKREKGKEAVSKALLGDVDGKIAIMIDDMICTGGSIVNGAKLLEDNGATQVYACATHGLFNIDANSKILTEEKLYRSGLRVLITDSIPRSQVYYDSCYKWLRVVSLAKYYADLVYCNEAGISAKKILDMHLERAIKEQTDINDYLIPQQKRAISGEVIGDIVEV